MFDFATAVAVIVGVIEVIKRASGLNTRYVPLLAVILGIITYIFLGDSDIVENILTGIIVGLSSIGLYAGTKKTVKG